MGWNEVTLLQADYWDLRLLDGGHTNTQLDIKLLNVCDRVYQIPLNLTKNKYYSSWKKGCGDEGGMSDLCSARIWQVIALFLWLRKGKKLHAVSPSPNLDKNRNIYENILSIFTYFPKSSKLYPDFCGLIALAILITDQYPIQCFMQYTSLEILKIEKIWQFWFLKTTCLFQLVRVSLIFPADSGIHKTLNCMI